MSDDSLDIAASAATAANDKPPGRIETSLRANFVELTTNVHQSNNSHYRGHLHCCCCLDCYWIYGLGDRDLREAVGHFWSYAIMALGWAASDSIQEVLKHLVKVVYKTAKLKPKLLMSNIVYSSLLFALAFVAILLQPFLCIFVNDVDSGPDEENDARHNHNPTMEYIAQKHAYQRRSMSGEVEGDDETEEFRKIQQGFNANGVPPLPVGVPSLPAVSTSRPATTSISPVPIKRVDSRNAVTESRNAVKLVSSSRQSVAGDLAAEALPLVHHMKKIRSSGPAR